MDHKYADTTASVVVTNQNMVDIVPQEPGYYPNFTNVVVSQPAPSNLLYINSTPPPPREWSSGLCGCGEDCAVCWCVLCCGGIYEMRLARAMGEHPCIICCTPAALIPMRTKLRTQYNIRGSICRDTVAWMFCTSCAVCQLGREMKYIRKCILANTATPGAAGPAYGMVAPTTSSAATLSTAVAKR